MFSNSGSQFGSLDSEGRPKTARGLPGPAMADLYRAAERGNVAEVESLLKAQADVTYKGGWEVSARLCEPLLTRSPRTIPVAVSLADACCVQC